jgi:outer membrane protein assembly factor BamB
VVAAQPSSGTVTADGAGVGGVLVCDGRHVTATGADGSFALPGHGPFVFLTRPSGFSTSRWFAPAGPGLGFALEREEQTVPFSFAQVSDLHLSLGDPSYGAGQGDATLWLEDGELRQRIVTTPPVLDELFAEVAGHRPSFVVATGDVTNTGTDAELVAYAGSVAGSPVAVVTLPGNHDHMAAAPPDFPYERHVGPRWFSFDYAGVHFVAVDWFTWRLGVDTADQEAWLAADLSAQPAGTPVVLLSHDQMDSAFFARLPLRPLASFSGHWHTTRVVEHDGTVHYTTGTATFGGLDYSPAHYRLATWDGTRLEVRTVVRGPERLAGSTMRAGSPTSADAGLRWAHATTGGSHLAGPVVAGDSVLVVSRQEDRPGGSLECLDLLDGSPRWTLPFAAAVKAEPLLVDGAAVVSSVSGETVCVDIGTGEVRWRVQVDDPLRPWVHHRPATDGSRVFVGDVGCFAALDLRDGSTVWTRTDLGVRENLTSFSHPVVIAGTLLVGFAGQQPPLWALDPCTGATRWPDADRGRSIYAGPEDELARHLPQVVMGGCTPDPDGADAYVVRLGALLERFDARTGRRVWAAPFSGWFNPAPPVVWGDSVLATEGSGRLFCFGRDGERRWVRDVGDAAPLAMGSYRASGPVTLAPPTVTADRALLPGGDGRIRTLEPADGAVVAEVHVGVPVTAALALVDGVVVAAGVDGVVRALDADALLR